MLLDTIRGTSRKELESTCKSLSAVVAEKKAELAQKEIQIERLSKNIRKWTRKYNELELSISETVIDTFDQDAATKAHEEETKHLQLMLIKLNEKNAKLERRLEKMSVLLEKANQQTEANSVPPQKEASEEAKVVDVDEVPEFAPEFQKVLNYYAETTPQSQE